MAHRLLEKYPTLDGNFLFLDVNAIIAKYLCPLLEHRPEMDDPKYRWKVWNELKDYYKTASDEDFIFLKDGTVCEEAIANQMWFRTNFIGENGNPIWLFSELNTRPDRSRWFVRRVTSMPGLPVRTAQANPEHAPSETVAAEPKEDPIVNDTSLPITQRYPDFFKLVFFHFGKVQEVLIPMTGDSTITNSEVQENFRNQYNCMGLQACRFIKDGCESTPDEADTLRFNTGYRDTAGHPIWLECVRNHNNLEPWFARYFTTDEWVNIEQLYPFYKKVFIYPTHLDKGLYSVTHNSADQLESASTKLAKIAKRFIALKPEEIIYQKGFYSVNDEADADHMMFPTGYFDPQGEEIMLRCKRNTRDKEQTWISSRFYVPSKNNFLGRKPGKWLFSWARFKSGNTNNPYDINDELRILHGRILKGERWSIGEENANHLSVLRNYFVYTFTRLWREGKIAYSWEGDYAAFNTGLVDPAYDYIYAMFIRNPQKGDCREWQFWGFCVADESRMGDTLSAQFSSRPKPARYFDPGKPIYYNFDDDQLPEAQIPSYKADHILKERAYRLPMKFLHRYDSVLPGLREKLCEIERGSGQDPETTKSLWRDVCNLIRNNDRAYREMKGDVDKAVKYALKRASWNYRTVVPYYDPNTDKICLLLPLCLASDDTPDAAMVVEPKGSHGQRTRYQGHTIITLAMAYGNSRLVCRPESDWLNLNAVDETRDIDMFDDSVTDED